MTAPSWATSPTPFAIDILADDILQDFADRGTAAKVVVGAWERFRADASPRVVLGLADAEGDNVTGRRWAPGPVVPLPGGRRARALWSAAHRFNVWIAHPPQPTTAPELRAREARARTWALLQATLAAMWRSHGGQFPWGALRWLSEDEGAGTYGGALTFVPRFDLPILDDALELVKPAEGADGAVTMSLDANPEPVEVEDAPGFAEP